jgi:hypothetical protein
VWLGRRRSASSGRAEVSRFWISLSFDGSRNIRFCGFADLSMADELCGFERTRTRTPGEGVASGRITIAGGGHRECRAVICRARRRRHDVLVLGLAADGAALASTPGVADVGRGTGAPWWRSCAAVGMSGAASIRPRRRCRSPRLMPRSRPAMAALGWRRGEASVRCSRWRSGERPTCSRLKGDADSVEAGHPLASLEKGRAPALATSRVAREHSWAVEDQLPLP